MRKWFLLGLVGGLAGMISRLVRARSRDSAGAGGWSRKADARR